MEGQLINRVANSGLITVNLEKHYPQEDFVVFDIKDYLFMELILKEKDFRQSLKELEWSEYSGKIVLIQCSVDAIIPVWANMLISSYLKNIASDIYFGHRDDYLNHYYKNIINAIDPGEFRDKRIVIKGCSEKAVPAAAYGYITERLKDIAQSIMFGEACSTVPIAKRPRVIKK